LGIIPSCPIESIGTDAGHAVWDGDGGQAAAVIEGLDSYAGHTVGDCDGCQAAAITECIVADAGHAISFATVCDRCRDNYRTRVRIIVCVLVSHHCIASREVVIDATNLGIVGTGNHWQQCS